MNKIELLLQQVLAQCMEANQKIVQLQELISFTKPFLTVDEFCRYSGLSKTSAYKLSSTGKLKHYKPTGRILLFKKSEVDEFLMSNPVSPVVLSEAKSSDYLMTETNKKKHYLKIKKRNNE